MSRLDNFIYIKLLGKGNFGYTYLAFHKDEYRYESNPIALKIIDVKESTEKGIDIQRILFEIRVLIELSSHPKCNPYIACYYQYFRENLDGEDSIFIVSEFVDGPSFENIIENAEKTKIKLSSNVILKYIYYLLSALNYIHKMGYAHRDIKPENIILQKYNNIPKLIDFGLACKNSCDNFVGSPYWTPPEAHDPSLLYSNIKMSQAQDIWALGIVSYEMANLCYPFIIQNYNPTLEDLIDSISGTLNPSIYNSGNLISDIIINNIIDTMLNKNWKMRATAKNLLEYMNDKIRNGEISISILEPDQI